MFRVDKFIILGPQQLKIVQLPFRFPFGCGNKWSDYLPLRFSPCVGQKRSDGTMMFIYHNQIDEPVHLTPRMCSVQCLLIDIEHIRNWEAHVRRSPAQKMRRKWEQQCIRGSHHKVCNSLEELLHNYPRVFDYLLRQWRLQPTCATCLW